VSWPCSQHPQPKPESHRGVQALRGEERGYWLRLRVPVQVAFTDVGLLVRGTVAHEVWNHPVGQTWQRSLQREEEFL
jgi:hypothetical protein